MVHLLPREKECLFWTARGKSTEEISMILEISFNTVKTYLQEAREKLNCRSIAQAVYVGIKAGLIE